MSTAAHEPRRVGPRRADSPSGSKVTPRRNAPETSEPQGLQYDSDELPVLIRLPNLRDIGTVETRTNSTKQKKSHRIDRASVGKQKASKQDASKVSKKSFQQHASDNKLVFGGIVGGILVVVAMFLFNASRSTPPADQDAWASESPEIELPVQEPATPLATEIAPPPPFPGFVYEPSKPETTQHASGQLEQASVEVPHLHEHHVPEQSETTALPNQKRLVDGWPSNEIMGSQPIPGSTPVDLWPGDDLSVEQGGGYENPSADSPSQTDYRSSMYPTEKESYRTGKLESDRPRATQGGSSSILNGNIEVPPTTSTR